MLEQRGYVGEWGLLITNHRTPNTHPSPFPPPKRGGGERISASEKRSFPGAARGFSGKQGPSTSKKKARDGEMARSQDVRPLFRASPKDSGRE